MAGLVDEEGSEGSHQATYIFPVPAGVGCRERLWMRPAHTVGRPGVVRVQGFSAGWSQAQELQLWAGELRPSASLFVVLSSGNAGQGGEPSHWLEDSLSLGDVPGC